MRCSRFRGLTSDPSSSVCIVFPQIPAAPNSYYALGQSGWTGWQSAWRNGKLADPAPIARYWAATGCLILGKAAEPAADDLAKLLDDPHSAIRVAAAQALYHIGKPAGKMTLLAELTRATGEAAQQNVINVLTSIDALNEIPAAWVTRTLNDKSAGEYLQRLAKRLRKERGGSGGK